MIALPPIVYYLGELFHPEHPLLGKEYAPHWFEFVESGSDQAQRLASRIREILSLDFRWPNRTGVRRFLPSRLVLFSRTRRWFGLPRPLLKDPIAVMSAEWLAVTFDMDVVALVRHPAAFVASLQRYDWRFDFSRLLEQDQLVETHLKHFRHQLENPPSDVIGEGALLWTCINHVLATYGDRNPDWRLLRLEEVAAQPIESFSNIYAALGLRMSPMAKRQILAHSCADNPVSAPNDPHALHRNSVEAQEQWRRELTLEEVSRIRTICEPVSCRYYPDSSWEL